MSETRGTYFLEEVAERLGMSRRQAYRLRRAGRFPIPELLRYDERGRLCPLDSRPRFSCAVVEQYLANGRPMTPARGTVHKIA